ncbi:unnamed protein product [Adineta ricciae]|nr:unnamed protein product [Adineta ricciae]
MSVVPQISARPMTLPINNQYANNSLSFTSNDKFSLSTPDLINVLVTPQAYNDGQPSPGTRAFHEMFDSTMTNINHPIQPSTHPLQHDMHLIVSNTAQPNSELISPYRTNRSNSQMSAMRDRSISSSMNEHDSSNSTAPSSPTGSYIYSNRMKDELQHVPSMRSSQSGDTNDVIKKERKRERNRQAAQKCRTRKLTRIAELQKRVNELQGKNKDLVGIADTLKADITKLERQLQDHHTQGCTLMNGSSL